MDDSERPASWYPVRNEYGFTDFRYFDGRQWTEEVISSDLVDSKAGEVLSREEMLRWLGPALGQAVKDVELIGDVEYKDERASSSGYRVAEHLRVEGAEAAERLRALGARVRERGDASLDDLVTVVGFLVGRAECASEHTTPSGEPLVSRTIDAASSLGNLGDVAPVGEGVSELPIDYGPGYRIDFCQQGATLVVLLAGGSKRTQKRDIETAKELAREP